MHRTQQNNEPTFPRQNSSKFIVGEDNKRSINKNASVNNKTMNFIDRTISNVNIEIERNKERLNLIRERSILINSSNNYLVKKAPVSTVIIKPLPSEIPRQIKEPAPDPFPCKKQDNAAILEDDYSNIIVRSDITSVKAVDFECSSVRKFHLPMRESTRSTVISESFSSELSTQESEHSLDYSLPSIGNDCDEDTILDHESKRLAASVVYNMNLQSLHDTKVDHLTQSTDSSTADASSCELPQHLRLGLTLGTIQKLFDRLPQDAVKACNDQIPANDDGTPTLPTNQRINGYVNRHFIRDWARVDDLSVCERLTKDHGMALGVGEANIFVCWDLSTGIQTLIDALREFLDVENLPEDSTFFWVRDYVVRQSDVISDLIWLGDCVKAVGFTVLISQCNALLPLKRAYCIQELYYTKVSNSKFKLVMGVEQQNISERTTMSIFNVNVAEAECQNTYEKAFILDDLKSNTTLNQCNKLVTELLQEELKDQNLKAHSKISNPRHNTSILVDNIPMLQRIQGRVKEARVPFEEHLRIHCSRIESSNDNQENFSTMYKVANLLREQGHFNKAQHLLDKTLTVQREVMGSTHRDTLTSMATLGLLLSQLELFDDAILLFKEALAGRRLILGLQHPHTLTSINNLAALLYQRHDFDQALPLFRESLRRSHEALGPKHPDTLCSISNLAVLLKDRGLFVQARPLYERALELKREVLGSEHPSTLRAVHNFAVFLKRLGECDKARVLYREAIVGRRKILGPCHPHTLNSVRCLGSMLDYQETLSGLDIL